ncbi:Fc receptor-like protein 5 [Cetorhinus maximus]
MDKGDLRDGAAVESKDEFGVTYDAKIVSCLCQPQTDVAPSIKPVITFNQPTGLYLFGEMVTITCTVTEDKHDKVFEFYRGIELLHDSKTATQDSFDTVPFGAIYRGGQYRCRYRTSINSRLIVSPMSEAVTVTIADPQKMPVISFDETTGVYAVGETITMTCTVTGDNREKRFHFYKGLQQLPSSPIITNTNTLTFPNTSLSHSGQYQCQYRVTVQSRQFDSKKSQAVTVIIADPPEPYISVDPSAVDLGGAVTFNCTSPGDNPAIAFYLHRQGDANHYGVKPAASGVNSVTFTIRDVDHSEIGSYTCRYEALINGRNLSSGLSDPVHITVTEKKHVALAVGIGVAVGVTFFLALLGVCLWRKGKKKSNSETRNAAPSGDEINENLTYAVLNLQTNPKRDCQRQRDTSHAQSEDFTLYAAVKR